MGIIGKIVGYPLGWVMYFIYMLVDNYGIAILLFTLLTRILLFPVSVKQQKSTAAMQAFSPKLEELKKKYKNNQQKLNEEQMKLYSEEGINPMASCLPMLLQFALLFGVIDVVYRPLTHILRISESTLAKATEIAAKIFENDKGFASRQELYIIKAINENPEAFSSLPDFVDKAQKFNNNLFGFIDLNQTPSVNPEVWNAGAIGLFLIPILAGVFQLLMTIYMQIHQKKSGQVQPQGMGAMNILLYIMPLFSVWIGFTCPAALGTYWTISSLLGLVQSVILYKIYTPEYVEELIKKDKQKKKKKKQSSMMERYQKYMESQGMVPANATVKDAEENTDEKSEESEDVKLSRAKQREMERAILREARKREAELYGEEYDDSDDDDDK